MTKPRIAIDAMSGDRGPEEVAAALALGYKQFKDYPDVTLVGDEARLKLLMKLYRLPADRVNYVPSTEVIEMHEKPLQALKAKKNASLPVAIDLVKQGVADAILSCGNTGALVAGGTLKLRTMEGVERPALATIMPTRNSHFVMLDAGANPASDARNLVHNAILGSHFAAVALKIKSPRVGLLTIGSEEGKGNPTTAAAHEQLKAISSIINYKGLIEGFQVFENEVDVVVCDGFTGNILLKTCEGLFKHIKSYAVDEMKKNPIRLLGAMLCMGAFKAMKKQLSPERYAAAPLLGLKGNVFKTHGSANRYAIANAVRIAGEAVSHRMSEMALADIHAANLLLEQVEAEAIVSANAKANMNAGAKV
jgi:glycerol-3-phosphate acyltransferase PlsX